MNLEHERTSKSFGKLHSPADALDRVCTIAYFVMVSVFLQGFWFGATLVHDYLLGMPDYYEQLANVHPSVNALHLARYKWAMLCLLSTAQDPLSSSHHTRPGCLTLPRSQRNEFHPLRFIAGSFSSGK